MKAYIAAAVQMSSTGDLDANLDQAQSLISEAVKKGAELVALPENFSFLGPEKEKVARAAEIGERSKSFLLEQAREQAILLSGGTFVAPAAEGKTWNRAVLAGPAGPLAVYDKIHLFDVDLPTESLRESDTVAAGDQVVVSPTDGLGTLGLSICYDLRFPELYRLLAEQGAEVLMIPAAFTKFTGAKHWSLLVRARAVENTCFAIAPNQCGNHFGSRFSYGHSLIVDPWGEVLAEAGDTPEVITATLDSDALADIRRRIPSLRHRRL
jgi:predicted amidohydrolase